jgi:hypothetical protein
LSTSGEVGKKLVEVARVAEKLCPSRVRVIIDGPDHRLTIDAKPQGQTVETYARLGGATQNWTLYLCLFHSEVILPLEERDRNSYAGAAQKLFELGCRIIPETGSDTWLELFFA